MANFFILETTWSIYYEMWSTKKFYGDVFEIGLKNYELNYKLWIEKKVYYATREESKRFSPGVRFAA